MINVNLFYNLDGQGILNLWKQVLLLDTPRRDCSVEWDDGIDLDSYLMTYINQWYDHMLTTAKADLLPIEDVKDNVVLNAVEGMIEAVMPKHCIRPVEMRLHGWKRSVTEFLQPGSHEANVQLNEWTRGGIYMPAVIDYGDRLVMTRAGSSSLRLDVARCVARPADGSFKFHGSLLDTIPLWYNEQRKQERAQ